MKINFNKILTKTKKDTKLIVSLLKTKRKTKMEL